MADVFHDGIRWHSHVENNAIFYELLCFGFVLVLMLEKFSSHMINVY